ncbi:MAG TPA: hypothetical protein DCS07_10565 [Bdellovibrionales bacterium]|nr:hypothetical protein [Bdellovibrionales bacterium]
MTFLELKERYFILPLFKFLKKYILMCGKEGSQEPLIVKCPFCGAIDEHWDRPVLLSGNVIMAHWLRRYACFSCKRYFQVIFGVTAKSQELPVDDELMLMLEIKK